MKQAIAGVTPSEVNEVTVMVVWPSIASTNLGQMLGRLYSLRVGIGPIFTFGNLIALATIPIAIGLYFLCKRSRYRLTNRRVIIERGPHMKADRSVALDNFDVIDVEIKPGQEWYPAGDLVFRKGNVETFRLLGVQRPETFRQTCLKSQRSYVGVRKAIEMQTA